MRAVLVLLIVMGATIVALTAYFLVLTALFAGRPYWLLTLLAIVTLMGVVALVGRRARRRAHVDGSGAA